MKKLITPNKIKKLTEKALKDKPISMPRNGYVYLKSLEPGTMFNYYLGGVIRLTYFRLD